MGYLCIIGPLLKKFIDKLMFMLNNHHKIENSVMFLSDFILSKIFFEQCNVHLQAVFDFYYSMI